MMDCVAGKHHMVRKVLSSNTLELFFFLSFQFLELSIKAMIDLKYQGDKPPKGHDLQNLLKKLDEIRITDLIQKSIVSC